MNDINKSKRKFLFIIKFEEFFINF